MRNWRRLLGQGTWLGAESFRGRRGTGNFVFDRALRLAAEVLEPRCLLTDATGLVTEDVNGDILVDASQWDDAGLTLLRDGDLVHLVRTGTTQDVITPFAADAAHTLFLQTPDDWNEIRSLDFGPENNDITVKYSGLRTATISESNLSIVITNLECNIHFSGGGGDDRIKVVSELPSVWEPILIDGGDGNDVLMGGDASDWLAGGAGNDTIFGQSGYDWISGGLGDDVIDGGLNLNGESEFNFLYEEALNITNLDIRLTTNSMKGFGDDRLENIEYANITIGAHSRIDASDFPFEVSAEAHGGNCTLIGGAGGDYLFASDGHNLVIGGAGDDQLGAQGVQDLLIGGAGDDVLCGADLGSDTLDGGSGNDSLFDAAGNAWSGSTESMLDDSNANAMQTLVVPAPAYTLLSTPPSNTLLGQGLNEPRDEGAALPEALVTDVAHHGDTIPNSTQTLIVAPANTLLGQGLSEVRDEGAMLPQTLVEDAESDDGNRRLSALADQGLNLADTDDSTETNPTAWDELLTNPLLVNELLLSDADA